MPVKFRKAATRVGLIVLLIFLATVPLTYPYLVSMLGLGPRIETLLDPNLAVETPVSPYVLLAYASLALESAQKGNYTEAEGVLAYIGNLPPNLEHNLETFITLVQELVALIHSLKSRLDQAKALLADGDVASGRQVIAQAESMLTDASGRLDLLFSALDRVQEIYRIDVSRQRNDLQALRDILHEFEKILAELKALLAGLDTRSATQLELWASPSPVWVERTLQITGYLQANGVRLSNRTVELWVNGIEASNPRLDQNGTFTSTYTVSSSNRVDKIEAYASFTPTGEDISTYRPTRSPTIIVSVLYYPVALTLVTSADRLHILENFTVSGTLTDTIGRALAGEDVELLIDGNPVTSSQTDNAGAYNMTASFAPGTSEGTHQLSTRFSPKQGIYSSALSNSLRAEIYYLKPTISLYSRNDSALSGQNLVLQGHLEIGSEPFAEGLVIALLGDRELGNASSAANGLFSIPITVPFDATGDTALTILFVPAHPWITSATALLVLRVLNSGLVGFGSLAFAVGAVTLYGKGSELGSALRRRRREPEQVLAETPKLEAETVPAAAAATIRLAELKQLLDDPHVCVKETYWEIRRLFAEALHDIAKQSETHREFETRIVTRLGDGATSFSLLTGLFQVAEYSQHALSRRDAEQAINCGIMVAETISVDLKAGGAWKRLAEERKARAIELLKQFGLRPFGVIIDTQNALVEIPWFLSSEARTQLEALLQNALHVHVGLIPVRFCNNCGYKFEGAAVHTINCPRCGTKSDHEEFEP